jgi:hypothetical protein
MAPCSTLDEAQTFQISCRQLFSYLRPGPAQEGSGASRPDAAKASSQRPQATLVTQPKIGLVRRWPGDTAERPFGSAGTVSQPAQDWRQIESSLLSALSSGSLDFLR